MKGILCYYSSTGNTKLACQYIEKNLKNIEFDLFDIIKDGIPDLSAYAVVGFAAFADFGAPSYLVQDFIGKLSAQKMKAGVVINTYGFIGGKTLRVLNKWVAEKGFDVIAGYSLHTPESYPPMIVGGRGYEKAPNEKEMAKFNEFISNLDKQFLDLAANKPVKKSKIKIGLLNSLIPPFARTKARDDMGEKFVDVALCTKCGICEKGCPYNAILLNPTPVFDMTKCYGCWRCFNKCPQKAIYTKKGSSRFRVGNLKLHLSPVPS